MKKINLNSVAFLVGVFLLVTPALSQAIITSLVTAFFRNIDLLLWVNLAQNFWILNLIPKVVGATLVAGFAWKHLKTRFKVDLPKIKVQTTRLATYSFFFMLCTGLFLFADVPVSEAATTATTGYILDTPYSSYDWLVGQYSDGNYYAINGSNWDNLVGGVGSTAWSAYTGNSTALVEQVLAACTSGHILLKDVEFDYDLTIPENVTVTERNNGLDRTFINSANSQGSPYTISVDTVQTGYYIAQDSAGRFIDDFTSTNLTALQDTVLGATTSGEIRLNEVAFDLALMNSIPEDVQVIESVNSRTRTFINSADSLGSPYTISVESTNYFAQDSANRYYLTSTSFSTLFQNTVTSAEDDSVIQMQTGQTYPLGTTTIQVTKPLQILWKGSTLTYSGTGTALNYTLSTVSDRIVLDGTITAIGDAVSSATAIGVKLQGINGSPISLEINEFRAGVGLQIVSAVSPIYQNEMNTFDLNFDWCKKGIQLIGDGSWSYNDFLRIDYGARTIENSVAIDTSQASGIPAYNWHIFTFHYWVGGTQTGKVIDGSYFTVSKIDKLTVEALPTGDEYINGAGVTVFFNCSESVIIEELHQAGFAVGWTLRNPNNVLKPIILSYDNNYGLAYGQDYSELMATLLMQGKLITITDLDQLADANVGTGYIAASMGRHIACTGGDAGSVGCGYGTIALTTATTFDWSKPLVFTFDYYTTGGKGAGQNAFVKIAPAATGNMTGNGIGIQVVNGDLYGISEGTVGGAQVSVNLNTALTDGEVYRITIVFTPGNKIDWYVGTSLVGSQTSTANIPSTSTESSLTHLITNGGDTATYYSTIVSPMVWTK